MDIALPEELYPTSLEKESLESSPIIEAEEPFATDYFKDKPREGDWETDSSLIKRSKTFHWDKYFHDSVHRRIRVAKSLFSGQKNRDGGKYDLCPVWRLF